MCGEGSDREVDRLFERPWPLRATLTAGGGCHRVLAQARDVADLESALPSTRAQPQSSMVALIDAAIVGGVEAGRKILRRARRGCGNDVYRPRDGRERA